jgi:hypothetical protein
VSSEQVFGGQVHADSEASRRFIATIVASLTPGTAGAAAQPGAQPASTTPATGAPAPAPAPASGEGARSFPLSDPKPGGEPR